MPPPTEGGASGLRLVADPQLDPAIARVCSSEADSFDAALGRWGRFRRVVRVRSTEDRAALRTAAGTSSSALLCALADIDAVTMLAPARWTVQPSHTDLRDALLHELAHVLTFQRCAPPEASASPRLPVWFREGLAAFVAEGPPAPNLRRQVAHRADLPQLAAAGADVMAEQGAACYLVARLVFAAWLEKHGDRGYAGLCRLMRGGAGFRAAHRKATGEEEAAFVREWVERAREEAASR